ncbi:MAG: CbiX/SirB N-terminal domain-containing protein, partial [Pseudomonadota bacterium]
MFETAPDGKKYGVMICGHGSRNVNAVDQFAKLAERLRERFPQVPVDYGYLEFANPVLHKGLDALKARGVNHVLAVPGMLFAAGHAKNDIPSVLNAYRAMNQDITVDYGRELGFDMRMIR